MSIIIDGHAIAGKIKQETKTQVAELASSGITPMLGVVLVGHNKASETYVGKKRQAAAEVGIDFQLFQFEENITEEALIENIQEIQKTNNLSGLIIQLPLPEQLYTPKVLNCIDPNIDVDCLTSVNLGKLFIHAEYVTPPTPAAVMSVIHELGIDLPGKNVTVVGVGALVGKPLSIMLMNELASVTTINSETQNPREKCLAADIIVTGVGKRNLITKDMVHENSIVIDTGFVFEDGKSSGDVDFDAIAPLVHAITPTPGGIGPITVAKLLHNTVLCAKNKNHR
jgi:methylenetetrahydrofolate dehydrogenase (NADP+)/methenyltetrahydrofolate cyclohydrolase